MAIWFTSDHHFGHANIIKYSVGLETIVAIIEAGPQTAAETRPYD